MEVPLLGALDCEAWPKTKAALPVDALPKSPPPLPPAPLEAVDAFAAPKAKMPALLELWPVATDCVPKMLLTAPLELEAGVVGPPKMLPRPVEL